MRNLSQKPVSNLKTLVATHLNLAYSLRDFRLQTHHFSSDRDEHVARAFRAFKSIESSHLQTRAEIARANRSLEQLVDGLAKVRRDCESSTCL